MEIAKMRKQLLWFLPLAGLSALVLLVLARTTDAPAESGIVIVAPVPRTEPEPNPVPMPSPTAIETPRAKTVLVPEAPAKTADGEVVTRCTDPEC